MHKVSGIISFLNKFFLPSKAAKWDKVGLHFGNKKASVSSIFITLDLDEEVLEKAINKKANLIITHHPFLWEETLEENFKINPYKLRIQKRLINNNISVFVLHTNYDIHKKGTSFQIAKELGFDENIIIKSKVSSYGVIIEKQNFSLIEICSLINKKLKIDSDIKLDWTNGSKINSFAILGGAGSLEEIISFKNHGIQTIITSDLKWADLITLKSEKINYINVSHGIEKVFTKHITKILNAKFKSIRINNNYND